MCQGQRVKGQQEAPYFFCPLFCRGKGGMEDEKDRISCGEEGRHRGKTWLGGGSMRHRRQVHAGIKPAWEGGGVRVA